jgi:hypothetical protein
MFLLIFSFALLLPLTLCLRAEHRRLVPLRIRRLSPERERKRSSATLHRPNL